MRGRCRAPGAAAGIRLPTCTSLTGPARAPAVPWAAFVAACCGGEDGTGLLPPVRIRHNSTFGCGCKAVRCRIKSQIGRGKSLLVTTSLSDYPLGYQRRLAMRHGGFWAEQWELAKAQGQGVQTRALPRLHHRTSPRRLRLA